MPVIPAPGGRQEDLILGDTADLKQCGLLVLNKNEHKKEKITFKDFVTCSRGALGCKHSSRSSARSVCLNSLWLLT